MNNINENRTDERTPGGEKNKAELKWFILFLAVIFFLPITILAVMEWFTSADAFAIGITGFRAAVKGDGSEAQKRKMYNSRVISP